MSPIFYPSVAVYCFIRMKWNLLQVKSVKCFTRQMFHRQHCFGRGRKMQVYEMCEAFKISQLFVKNMFFVHLLAASGRNAGFPLNAPNKIANFLGNLRES